MYRKYRTEHSIYMHDSLKSELLWERYLRWSTQRFEQWKSSSYFSLIPFENWPQTMSIFLDRKWFRKGFAKTMREKNHWNHNKKPYNLYDDKIPTSSKKWSSIDTTSSHPHISKFIALALSFVFTISILIFIFIYWFGLVFFSVAPYRIWIKIHNCFFFCTARNEWTMHVKHCNSNTNKTTTKAVLRWAKKFQKRNLHKFLAEIKQQQYTHIIHLKYMFHWE